MDALTQVIAERQGWFSRADAVRAGVTDRDLSDGLRRRTLRRLRQGAYCTCAAYDELDDRGRHILLSRTVLAAQTGPTALVATSAAAVHGLTLWGQNLDTVHLVRLDGGSARVQAGCAHHVVGSSVVDDVEAKDGLMITSLARTTWDVARGVTLEAGVAAADSALALEPSLSEALRTMACRFEHHPGSRRARIVMRLADGRAESPGESLMRVQLYRAAIPYPELQFPVVDASGRLLGTSDFAWPEHRHLAEFDGKVKYDVYLRPGESPADAVFREKKREDAIRAQGYGMTRLTWTDLMPKHVVATMSRLRSDLERSRRLYVR